MYSQVYNMWFKQIMINTSVVIFAINNLINWLLFPLTQICKPLQLFGFVSHPAKMDLNKKLGPKPRSIQTMLFNA